MPLNEIVAARHSTVRRKVLLGMAAIALTWTHGAALAVTREPLKVVATFSILGDMVREIGGGRVAVTTIVGPNSDAHHFEPTPQDAKALQEAAVLVLNGLDFEAWLPRLVEASGFKGRQILASKGVKVRRLADAEGHGEGGHDDRPPVSQKRISQIPQRAPLESSHGIPPNHLCIIINNEYA